MPGTFGYTSAADFAFSMSRANVAYGARMCHGPRTGWRRSSAVSTGLTDTPEITGLSPAIVA